MEATSPREASVPPSPRRPRVLRIATDLSADGPGRQTITLNRELKPRGFDCRLVWGAAAGAENHEPPPSVPATYIPYLQSRGDLLADARALLAIDGMIRRWNPQIVHTDADKAGVLGRLVAQRRHVPITLHSFNGAGLRDLVSESRAAVTRERALARRTDALLVSTSDARDRLLSLGIGSREQWHVVPLGLDLEPLIAERPDPREARAQLGIPGEGPIVGCVGSGDEEDHGTFLAAAAQLLRARPDATVVFVGESALRERLRSRARGLLFERCVFLRPVRHLPTLYAALDVVVRTSLRGAPASLVEAAAAGKPVVATRTGGIREVVREGETGLLVAPRDPSALAASLLMLLEDPEGARRMGAEGTAWVRARFSAHRLAEDVSEIYRDLLDRRAFTFGRLGPQRVLAPAHPRFSGSASAIR